MITINRYKGQIQNSIHPGATYFRNRMQKKAIVLRSSKTVVDTVVAWVPTFKALQGNASLPSKN